MVGARVLLIIVPFQRAPVCAMVGWFVWQIDR